MESTDTNLTIFKHITSIIIDPEFNVAIQDFYEKHTDTFDENVEENKHEYKAIYEEYVDITEKVIEARLKEQHGVTDDQIAAFLLSFKDNKKTYEDDNTDTVDALYAMIDFDKFKEKMIQAKKGMKNDEIKSTNTDTADKYQ